MLTLKDSKALKKITLSNSQGLTFEYLENGSLYAMKVNDILINQLLGTPLESSVQNMYLRVQQGKGFAHIPLLGPLSPSTFYHAPGQLSWAGYFKGVHYQCSLTLAEKEKAWFWSVTLENNTSKPVVADLMLAQDLALANAGAVRLNEAYISQYIDHSVLKHGRQGYVLNARQNQAQGKKFPAVAHGCLQKATGFATDGFQFYGLDYKVTNVPQALSAQTLPNQVLQYEFAMAVLQSAPLTLPPHKPRHTGFFGYYNSHQPQATSNQLLEDIDRVLALAPQALAAGQAGVESGQPKTLFDQSPLFQSRDLTAKEVEHYFPGAKRHVEKKGGTLHSFFYSDHYYVALKAKERLCERPHGHILRSGRDTTPSDHILATTAFMAGVFNAQVTVGNTSFNKLIGVMRNHLNVLKSSGQRLFIKTGQGYELLGMPSAFEMGLNHCRWIYKGRKATVMVKTWTHMDMPAVFMDVCVEGRGKAEFLVTYQMVMGNNEWDAPGRLNIDVKTKRVECRSAKSELMTRHYPRAAFHILPAAPGTIRRVGGDELLFSDGRRRAYPYLVFETKPVNSVTMMMTGNVLSRQEAGNQAQKLSRAVMPYEKTLELSQEYGNTFCNQAVLGLNKKGTGVERLNDILRWYFHNAMIHYLIPHGLEQYSGAAWGLRDVCQGPVELLAATRNYSALKQVLKMIFSHQLIETGDWPQWFMFDRYQEIQAPDSHGDIIVWPIKAVCDYIESSADTSILKEKIPYSSRKTRRMLKEKVLLLEHIKKEIARIKANCVAGTALISYGHGDWEDTLQPADPEMRKKMISTWTVELTYQTLRRFSSICRRIKELKLADDLDRFTARMKEDFNTYLVKNKVAAGLVFFHGKNNIEYILHPSDRRTGIKYRLLPMTRGMISGMLSKPQMETHYQLINKYLLFPDGVRLMARPIPYLGGVEKNFKRAETASCFGREIALQYVHAHIRYIEALAKIGRPEAMHQALLTINPIDIKQSVPLATARQSNVYFSSSDADFRDRYQANKEFRKIKQGQINIKGGWRIYSSGPGIYMYQLIANFLGLRELFDEVVIDPVLPKKLDQLTFDFDFGAKKVTYCYHVKDQGYSPSKVMVNGKTVTDFTYIENPYRPGGMAINKKVFERMLGAKSNQVDIFI